MVSRTLALFLHPGTKPRKSRFVWTSGLLKDPRRWWRLGKKWPRCGC